MSEYENTDETDLAEGYLDLLEEDENTLEVEQLQRMKNNYQEVYNQREL